MGIIYRLLDIRDGSTHYIGKTGNLGNRLAQHLACDGSNILKDAWIQEIGLDHVGIEQIDSADGKIPLSQKETYWIHYYHDRNAPLTNSFIPAFAGKNAVRRGASVGKTTRRTEKYYYCEVALPKGNEAVELLVSEATRLGKPLRVAIREACIIAYSDGGLEPRARQTSRSSIKPKVGNKKKREISPSAEAIASADAFLDEGF